MTTDKAKRAFAAAQQTTTSMTYWYVGRGDGFAFAANAIRDWVREGNDPSTLIAVLDAEADRMYDVALNWPKRSAS